MNSFGMHQLVQPTHRLCSSYDAPLFCHPSVGVHALARSEVLSPTICLEHSLSPTICLEHSPCKVRSSDTLSSVKPSQKQKKSFKIQAMEWTLNEYSR